MPETDQKLADLYKKMFDEADAIIRPSAEEIERLDAQLSADERAEDQAVKDYAYDHEALAGEPNH